MNWFSTSKVLKFLVINIVTLKIVKSKYKNSLLISLSLSSKPEEQVKNVL